MAGNTEQVELGELRWHWGDAYLIEYFGGEKWVAQRRDSHATLGADSPAKLLARIREDYAAHPVSRTSAPRQRQRDCRFWPEG